MAKKGRKKKRRSRERAEDRRRDDRYGRKAEDPRDHRGPSEPIEIAQSKGKKPGKEGKEEGERHCAKDGDCPDGLKCHGRSGICYNGSDETKGVLDKLYSVGRGAKGSPSGRQAASAKRQPKHSDHSVWNPLRKPGSEGFNRYAWNMMDRDGVLAKLGIQCPIPGKEVLQAYQQTVRYLVHPATTVNRFLVAHSTGAGKSLTMVRVLENFYDDPRPKVIIFPNDKVRNNFYGEIMKWNNRYRDFVTRTTGIKEWTDKHVDKIIDTLALKGSLHKAGSDGFPAAPLRALRYTIAGGSTVFPERKGGKPSNVIFANNYNGRNPYDDKVVIMDEFHNLMKPSEDVKQYQSKLDRLKAGLMRARNTVMVGLTATPVVDDPTDVAEIMKLVKGEEYRESKTNEGFVSFFQTMPLSVYPKVLPSDPDTGIPSIRYVKMQGDNLKKYNEKVRQKVSDIKLQNYCCTSIYHAQSVDSKTKAGKQLLKEPASVATKLNQVVKDVMNLKHKALVMMHRESGFKVLQRLFEIEAEKRRVTPSAPSCATMGACWSSMYDPVPSNESLLKLYNHPDNAKGKIIKAMLVDSKFYSEGISFRNVRHLVLVDVPRSWAAYKQQIGRVLRFCSHQDLPYEDWNVDIIMYVATHPERLETADQRMVKRMLRQRVPLIEALSAMERYSVDGVIIRNMSNDPRILYREYLGMRKRLKEMSVTPTNAFDREQLKRQLLETEFKYLNARIKNVPNEKQREEMRTRMKVIEAELKKVKKAPPKKNVVANEPVGWKSWLMGNEAKNVPGWKEWLGGGMASDASPVQWMA